jgi:hypothetical protein
MKTRDAIPGRFLRNFLQARADNEADETYTFFLKSMMDGLGAGKDKGISNSKKSIIFAR